MNSYLIYFMLSLKNEGFPAADPSFHQPHCHAGGVGEVACQGYGQTAAAPHGDH